MQPLLEDCYGQLYITMSGELTESRTTMQLGHRDLSLGTIVVPDGICDEIS